MEAEHAADENAPTDGFKGVVIVENVVQPQAVVLQLVLIRIVVKQVLLGWLVVLDVLPSELVNLCDLLSVLFSPLVKLILIEVFLAWLLSLAWELAE